MRAEILSSAKEYAEAGYSVFKVEGKIPKKKDWPRAEYLFPDQIADEFKDWDGNIGVALSSRDLVIDIDPRNFKNGDKPHVRLFRDAGIDPKEITKIAAFVKTGGGGTHIYLRLRPGVMVRKNSKEYPGIDFLSTGHYVVGVGSLHASGKEYIWAGGVPLTDIKECPDKLLALIEKRTAKNPEPDSGPASTESRAVDSPEAIQRYTEYLQTEAPAAIEGDNGDQTTFRVACKGRDLGLTENTTSELMLGHYNHRCIPEWSPRELRFKVHNAYSYAAGPVGSALPESDFQRVETVPRDPRFRGWDKYENGRLQKTLNNVFNYFIIADSPLVNTIAYDEFNGQVRIVNRLPWHEEPLPAGGLEWRDEDSIQLRLWLSRSKQFDVPIQVIDQTVLVAAALKILHPVKDYLRQLRWDGKPRLETWLVDYAGAKDDRFVREASKKFLLQAVSRIYRPGCKADHVVVLEGPQGVGKSSLVHILGGLWYGDIVIDPHSRDTVDAMRGKWFIEFSEMEVVNKHEAQALKAFITRQVDRVRLAYGRRSVDLPRQCVFMGTMNPDATGEYLTDATGNRRIWPILIRQVKFQELQDARDQLFAEAVDLVLKGEASYIIDKEVSDMAAKEQRSRQTTDPWGEAIREFVLEKDLDFLTTKDIWVFALKGNEANLQLSHQRRIAGCLSEMGYSRHVRRDPVDGTKVIRGFMKTKILEARREVDGEMFL